jgi:hypothetical protein
MAALAVAAVIALRLKPQEDPEEEPDRGPEELIALMSRARGQLS